MGRLYEVTVEKDENVKEKITQYILEQGWEDVYISGAVGSVRNVKLTNPVSAEFPPRVGTTECAGPCEVVAFTGEVMKRERMDPVLEKIYPDKTCPFFVHVHASVGVAGSHMYGGGFHDGYAFRKLRVFLQPLDEQE